MVMNVDRKNKLYTEVESDFWIDRFYHCSISKFNNLSSNLNGLYRSSIQQWMGSRNSNDLGLTPGEMIEAARFCKGMSSVSSDLTHINLEQVDMIDWSDTTCIDVAETEPFALMIDETATKIIVEYNSRNSKLYGWSIMPR